MSFLRVEYVKGGKKETSGFKLMLGMGLTNDGPEDWGLGSEHTLHALCSRGWVFSLGIRAELANTKVMTFSQ